MNLTRLARAAAAATLLLAVAATGGPAAPAPPPTTPLPYAPSWSAVHADGANSDYSPVEPATDVALAWHRQFDGSISIGLLDWTINLGPTIGPDGRVYLTSTVLGCHLQALDGATGETLWCAPGIDLFAVMSSPLIDTDGNLYIADGTGMHGLAPDGNERWRTPLDGVPLSAQFTPDGHVVFVTHAGTVYVLDRTTGAHVLDPVDLVDAPPWTPGTGLLACARGTADCPSANTVAVDAATGRLFFTLWEAGAEQASLRAMTYTSDPEPALTDLWSVDTLPGGSGASPTLSPDGRRVYVTDNAGSIHALDAATGETAWTFPIGYAAGGSISLSPEGLLLPAGGSDVGLIAVRDAGDEGVLAWRRDDLPNRGIATQSAGGKVYATVHIGGQRNDLVVLDAADGTILDREAVPGITVFSVGTTIGPDGTVYVPSINGHLAAYRAPSFPQGPDPIEEALLADGPFATATVPVPDGVEGFGGGVIHHPVADDGTTFGVVALAPGFLGSSANYGWWGPRLASHGFVVLLMDTETRTDLPASRGSQLLAALDWLASASPVAHLVDGERQAVVGHSLGGGGVLAAATARPGLRAAVALQPFHTAKDWPDLRVPTLVVGAELDTIAPPDTHAARLYEGVTAAPAKAYVELAGAPHSVSTAGDDTQGLFVLAWLKRFVDGDVRYEQFLCPNPGPGGALSDRRDTCPTLLAAERTTTGSITGTVTAGGQPVAGVTVLAYETGDGWTGSGEATTGPDGRYRIDGLPAGEYRVYFGPPAGSGLAVQWYPGVAMRNAGTPLTIVGGPVPVVDASLEVGAVVTGTVTGPGGAPVAGAVVWAFAPHDQWVGSGLAMTAADGSFTIGGLLPGPYQVAFVPPAGSGLAIEWHDDTPWRDAATVLDLPAGTTQVDAQLG